MKQRPCCLALFVAAILATHITSFADDVPNSNGPTTMTQRQLDFVTSSLMAVINIANGPMSITVDLFDESSNTLSNVDIYGDCTITYVLGQSTKSISTTATAQYSADFTSCTMVNLTFSLSGYRSVEKTYNYTEKSGPIPIAGERHVYSDSIVMKRYQKSGKTFELPHCSLQLFPDKSTDVFVIETPKPQPNTADYQFPNASRVDDVTSPELVTSTCIYLTLTTTETTIEPAIFDYPQSNGQFHITPRNAYLEFVMRDNCSTSGFVIIPGSQEWKWRQLNTDASEAPETGYKPRLMITKEMLLSRNDIFFYLRINGVYGKGRLSSLHYEYYPAENRNEAGAGLYLYLQLDGSRNVVTDE